MDQAQRLVSQTTTIVVLNHGVWTFAPWTLPHGHLPPSPKCQCQSQIYIAHNRKASNALCSLAKREKKLSCPGEHCQRNVTDLAGSQVTSSKPPGRPQKRPDDRTWNAGVAARTADGSRRTADAGDEQCLRCGCNSPSCRVVLCAADADGPHSLYCTR